MDEHLNLDFLDRLQRSGIVPGLERIRPLLDQLGRPQDKFRSVLVAGTNGKGSTAAFLEAVLRCAGHRTGLFTSPHLVDVRERIRVGGLKLSAKRFESYGRRVRSALEQGTGTSPTTYFETLTAIGFSAFAEEGVEVAVVEAGMGGRYDSTNVIEPDVSVLTNVSMDHQRFLGNKIEEIALEKVGIARKGRVTVTGVPERLFEDAVGPGLQRLEAIPRLLGRDFVVGRRDGVVDWKGLNRTIEGVAPSLAGTFQVDNAAIALAAAEALEERGVDIGETSMRKGVESTTWPGRFQVLSRQPTVILDGCHNPGAADRLAETLDASPPGRPVVLVHGSKPQKDFVKVLERLIPFCDHCIETTIPGLLDAGTLAKAARGIAGYEVEDSPDPADAMRRASKKAGPGGSILVTGSLHLVGWVLADQGEKTS